MTSPRLVGMTKPSEHERILRVHDVYQKLVQCWAASDICQYSSAQWGVDDRTTFRYIAEAREKLRTYLDTEKADWVAQKLTTLERMARDELMGGPDGASTGNRLAALQMIRTQAQFLDVLK